jgi:hypothetical protein
MINRERFMVGEEKAFSVEKNPSSSKEGDRIIYLLRAL